MESLHQAIILQPSHSYYQVYLIFDQKLGTLEVRVSARTSRRELPRGTLIEYIPQQSQGRYVATRVEIIAFPEKWVIHHIWFLQHLLELINFFVPRNYQAENIFILLLMLYKPLHDDLDMIFFQKFFLCKFFIMAGIYPEPINAVDKQFLAFIVSDNDYVFDQQKYVFLEKKMIQWLHECIRLHPYADRLKTMIMEPWYGEKNSNT